MTGRTGLFKSTGLQPSVFQRRRGQGSDRGSSNGRTPDSGSGYQGSNPCPRTNLSCEGEAAEKLNRDWPDGLAVRTVPSHGTISGSIPDGVTTKNPHFLRVFRLIRSLGAAGWHQVGTIFTRRCPERVGLSLERQEPDVAVTRPGREVTVSLAGRDRGVPEPPLHHTQGSAARDEDARERVPQPVPGDAAQTGGTALCRPLFVLAISFPLGADCRM